MEKAPAKINLGLDILGKRPDGLHELAMVMASIDLADRLYLEEIPEDRIIIETNKAFLPTDKKNHVYEALELVKERFEIKKGLRVKIHKEIPVAAGLGGAEAQDGAALHHDGRVAGRGLAVDGGAEIGARDGDDGFRGEAQHGAGQREFEHGRVGVVLHLPEILPFLLLRDGQSLGAKRQIVAFCADLPQIRQYRGRILTVGRANR